MTGGWSAVAALVKLIPLGGTFHQSQLRTSGRWWTLEGIDYRSIAISWRPLASTGLHDQLRRFLIDAAD